MDNKEILIKLKDYLSANNFKPKYNESKKRIISLCPFHDDHNPSFNIFENENGYLVYNCFSCKESGSLPDFINKLNLSEYIDIGFKHKEYSKKFYTYLQERLKFDNLADLKHFVNKFGLYEDKGIAIKYKEFINGEFKETGDFKRRNYPGSRNKYYSNPGAKKQLIFLEEAYKYFNPYALIKNKFPPFVVLTEGIFDALSLWRVNIPAVSIEGSGNIKKYLQDLKNTGFSILFLMFDNDEKGREYTVNYLKMGLKEFDFKMYVLDVPEEFNDVNEWFIGTSINDFKDEIIEQTSTLTDRNGFLVLSDLLFGEWLRSEDTNKKITGIDNLVTLYDSLRNPEFITEEDINKTLAYFGIDSLKWKERLLNIREIKREKKLKNEIKDTLNNVLSKIEYENLNDITSYLSSYSLSLKSEIKPKQIDQKDKFLQALEEAKNRKGLLGYPSEKFSDIVKHMDGIQPGFYIVAGHPNVGKTAFTINLFLDLLKVNEELYGVYYSLDDNDMVIFYRMLAILSNLPINDIQKEIIDEEDLKRFNGAKEWFFSIFDKRLFIRDISTIQNISDLQIDIENLYKYSNGNLLVMIDGLHNLEIPENKGTLRETNIIRANKIKEIVDLYNIPVFTTTELRKPDNSKHTEVTMFDINETGKYAYNANLILGITESNTNTSKQNTPLEQAKNILNKKSNNRNDEIIDIKIIFLKNKLSWFKGSMNLKFVRHKNVFYAIKEGDFNV